jgi:propanol-preferring alcohol dehydrogenase
MNSYQLGKAFMKAMSLTKPMVCEESPLQLMNVPMPTPGPTQVLVKVEVCGVCRTDLHLIEGDINPQGYPIVPGHQAVGLVYSVGNDVTTIEIGDRVGVPWLNSACGNCQFCQSGSENLCNNAQYTGFHMNGGFAEYVLADSRFVLPLPDIISSHQAAPLLCAGIIGYRSLKKSDLVAGECLGLFGFGASAHLTIQVAKYWKCEVYVFTRSQNHKNHALELGADWVGEINDRPSRELDRGIVFAPAGEIIPKALEKIRPGGTLAINAVYMTPIPKMPYDLIYGERTLRSVANATYQDGVEFLKLAATIPIKSTVQPFDLVDANQALLNLKYSRLKGEALLIVSG